MGKVPRHDFVRTGLQPFAYEDMPLPSGYDKTISQPFIVAPMTDLLDLQPTDIVLEVGTGLGSQTAILAELARHVYSVELIDGLAVEARQRLARHGCTNVLAERSALTWMSPASDQNAASLSCFGARAFTALRSRCDDNQHTAGRKLDQALRA